LSTAKSEAKSAAKVTCPALIPMAEKTRNSDFEVVID